MLRSLFALFAFSGLALSASAHPGEATPAVNSDSQPSSALTSDIVSTLPTDAEIRDILAQMPDMNALMGDMLKIMKDENMQAQLKSTATAFRQKLKSTPEFTQRDANGLPDINAFLGAILPLLADENAIGGLLEGATDIAAEMENSVQKHIPKGTKPLEKTPH